MRWAFGLVSLLIAMALVLYLSSRETEKATGSVRGGVPALMQEGVAPRRFDDARARDLLDELRSQVDSESLDEVRLADVATLCSSWAAGSAPGSREYRVAVKLRGAAGELQAAALGPEARHRQNARRFLREAQASLDGEEAAAPGPVGGIRDQLENLQQSQRERQQEVERELK